MISKKWEHVDGFTLSLIRHSIYDMYAAGKSPTLDMILKHIMDKTQGTNHYFRYGRKVLWELMKKVGFRWKKKITETEKSWWNNTE